MSAQSVTVVQQVADLDAALVAVVAQVARHGFVQPQVSIVPTLLPPDDSHVDPWPGFRVWVAGLVDTPVERVPMAPSWPAPKAGGQ